MEVLSKLSCTPTTTKVEFVILIFLYVLSTVIEYKKSTSLCIPIYSLICDYFTLFANYICDDLILKRLFLIQQLDAQLPCDSDVFTMEYAVLCQELFSFHGRLYVLLTINHFYN